MKKLSPLLCVATALLLMARFSPVAAQYNPPPPPQQQDTGESPDQGQMNQGPPPPDQGGPSDQAPPGADDQSAPPPGGDMQDQGAPGPDDQGAPPDAQGDDSDGDVNFQTFYNNLSSQGNWVQTDNYGYVWQPNEDNADWAPYTDGHWVYTDEGWTWVAGESEPWGWATYHYGRWANLDGYGWVWVPGYTWAPAWVSWRYGGGYCGWAPLPPDTFVGIDFNVGRGLFHIGGDCDTAFGIGPGYYNFLPVAFIGGGDYRGHYINRNNNFAIIANTRNVTSINVNRQRGAGRFGRVNAGGPSIATINAQSRTPVQRVSLARSNRVGNASLSGNRLSVYAPRVQAAGNGATFRPSHVSANVANARVNRGANINDPLQVNSRVRGTAPNATQIAASRNAHYASNAQIATANARPSRPLTQSLSALRPHTEADRTANSVRPAAQANRAANNAPATRGARAEDNFTGEGGNEVHHAGNTAPARAETQVATPKAQVEQHEAVQHQEAPHQEAQRQDVQHQEAPRQEVPHQEAPRQEVQHQEAPRQEAQHQEAPRQESHPQPQHAAPQHAPKGGSHAAPAKGGKDDNKH
jgi:hypothetical protein